MNKYIKWVGIVILIPIVLFFCVAVLFYFPPFQRWMVKEITAYTSEKNGMDIHVGSVRLAFPLDLALEDVQILQHHNGSPAKTDTVAFVGKLIVDIEAVPLFHGQVMVNTLSFDQLKLNSTDFIPSMHVQGMIGHLSLASHGIDLKKETVLINQAILKDANLSIAMADSVPPDTSTSVNHWKVQLQSLKVLNTGIKFLSTGDSISVVAHIHNGDVKQGYFDLEKSLYQVRSFQLKDSYVGYDRKFETPIEGFDYNHLSLTALNVQADSILYDPNRIQINIRQGAFEEKCGLGLADLKGQIKSDTTSFDLSRVFLSTTAGSSLRMDGKIAVDAFDAHGKGIFDVGIKGQVAKKDMVVMAGSYLPQDLKSRLPNEPLVIVAQARGNVAHTKINTLHLSMPHAVAFEGKGELRNWDDLAHLQADMSFQVNAADLAFATSMLDKDMQKKVHIPRNIGLDGKVKIDGQQYQSTFAMRQGHGTIKGTVNYNHATQSYAAEMVSSSFPLHAFLPEMPLRPLTAEMTVKGRGMDFMVPSSTLQANVKVSQFGYDTYNLDHLGVEASMSHGKLIGELTSDNGMAQGSMSIDMSTAGHRIHGTANGHFTLLDLHRMGITADPFTVALSSNMTFSSDLKAAHEVKARIADLVIVDNHKTYRPEDIKLNFITAHDTTHAVLDCADFQVNLDSRDGVDKLMSHTMRFVDEVQKQVTNKRFDQQRMKQYLPNVRVFLTTGHDNILAELIQRHGIALDHAFMNMTSSSAKGLNGELLMDSLIVNDFQLDTIRVRLRSDDSTMVYSAQVRNTKSNPTYVFNAMVNGMLTETGTSVVTRFYDKNDKLGIRLSLQALLESQGVRFHLNGNDQVLGYTSFAVNDSNYIFLGNDQRVSADMILHSSDGRGIQVYSNDKNHDVLQDVTVSLHKFNMGDVLSMLPYTPDMQGILDGDFHVIQTHEDLSVSSSLNINHLVYEGNDMGNIGSEFVYMPKDNDGSYVDGFLTYNGREIGVLKGTYYSKDDGLIDAMLEMKRFPMDMINGFIPDKLVGFKGYAEGAVSIKGSVSHPDVNGEVYLDSTYMFSEPYGVEMRFANDPVAIKNSRLMFENFEMFAHNNSPLNVQGYFDFADMNKMSLNVKMRARNYLLIDAEENTRSDAYGTAYVNFDGTMKGLLDNLVVNGRLDVLGSTDLKYNLKDSPLSTDNQLEGLVDFVNFKDTTKQKIERPELTGLSMNLAINIDEGAHVDCFLNADHSNYVDLVGGGEMRFQYNSTDDMRLTGRYTIGQGQMKYSLPIIPLKTFDIEEGSYLEFTGDVMNPKINLTATEETKSTVGEGNGDGRVVNFVCGVQVSKTLKDMGLSFIIDAPEDMAVSNQLRAMSKEQRGKIAVTMLTTGMYLADGNTKGFTMNSALSAFLNSQINSISNKALRSLDLSFGVDNSFDKNGAFHTDYSFKFAKRFWNNRLRVIIGGKFSSGTDVNIQDETFFDNVTLEYRLSPTSNKYLNLFYKRDDYDWLEGNVSKFGGGFMWKRKLSHFWDIFKLHRSSSVSTLPQDSVQKVKEVK